VVCKLCRICRKKEFKGVVVIRLKTDCFHPCLLRMVRPCNGRNPIFITPATERLRYAFCALPLHPGVVILHIGATVRIFTEEAFWSNVVKTDACWFWTKYKNKKGYGLFKIKGRTVQAHRIAFELICGRIPTGYVIHHECDSKHCVNPLHLVPLTKAKHAGLHHPRQQFCSRGHALVEGNLYHHPDGRRNCIICTKMKTKESWERRHPKRHEPAQ